MDIRTQQTYDLLQPVFSAIKKTFTGKVISTLSPGVYKITTCSTLWLTKNFTVTIGANDYKVVDFLIDQWIQLTGSVLPVTAIFDIYAPKIFHGDIMMQNIRLGLMSDKPFEKFPMIWMHERTEEKMSTDPSSNIDRSSQVDIFFLIDFEKKDWLQEDHDKYAVKPMRNLAFAFVDALYDNPSILREIDFSLIDCPNFGSYRDDKGNVIGIFSENCSGTEFKSILNFVDTGLNCEC